MSFYGNMQPPANDTSQMYIVAAVCVLCLLSLGVVYWKRCEWLEYCDDSSIFSSTSTTSSTTDTEPVADTSMSTEDVGGADSSGDFSDAGSTGSLDGGSKEKDKKSSKNNNSSSKVNPCVDYKKDRRITGPKSLALKSIKNVAKWQDCCKACGKTSGCGAWTHNLETSKCSVFKKSDKLKFEKASSPNVYRSGFYDKKTSN